MVFCIKKHIQTNGVTDFRLIENCFIGKRNRSAVSGNIALDINNKVYVPFVQNKMGQ